MGQPPPVTELQPLDRGLLERLRAARDQWADKARIQRYQVLHNAVLEELARTRPTTLDGILAIKGIGPAKVAKYGERLLEMLAAAPIQQSPSGDNSGAAWYLTLGAAPKQRSATGQEPRIPDPTASVRPASEPTPTVTQQQPAPSHGPPSHYWTWRLLERGFTQSECSIIRDIDEPAVLAHAILAAREGHAVPLDAFLTEDQIETLGELISRNPPDQINRNLTDLPDSIQREHVQLYVLNRELESVGESKLVEGEAVDELPF
jgi:hypothetical protein